MEKAADWLAGIRSSLLLFTQGRLSAGELSMGHRKLAELKAEAEGLGLVKLARIAADSAAAIELFATAGGANLDMSVNSALDNISLLEAELLQMPLGSDGFLIDVNDMVEASFRDFDRQPLDEQDIDDADEDFEVDGETLEIFRSEADGLLANIAVNLKILRSSPGDSIALWEIRRNAHTFKGAAGIIGFREASQLAHRIEDVLDKMVESGCGADGRLIELLSVSTDRLTEMTAGKHVNEDPQAAAALSDDFDKIIDSVPASPAEIEIAAAVPASKYINKTGQVPTDGIVSLPAPVVRVSLDRLDDLLKLSRSMLINRSALAERFDELKNIAIAPGADPLKHLAALLETQRHLSDEMQQRLLQIRMVRFGTLEMRLNRAVHVTCQEENKKASVVIENADLEIDTLMIDALIEPLLHLLKNAVVHGIEPPETRRLVGKPEKGRICVNVQSDAGDVILSVEDDGRGISSSKLIEKALTKGVIDKEAAISMDEQAIYRLIFERGMTTADSLNLNAGRGIGMNIVKDCVEARRGTISIDSEQQRGTKFTLRVPVAIPVSHAPEPEPPETLREESPLILIVDDSQSIRRMTAKIVEEAGLRAITAASGADALELLLSGKWEPDLILTDVEMPVMDGWTFLEYVKTDDNFGHIPVVMVTSLDSDEFRQKAIDLGAANYLVKPFGVAGLEKVCEHLIKAETV